MDVKRDIRFRVYLSFTGIVILAVAIIVKALTIQVNEGESLRAQAEKAHTKEEKLFPERGNIYSEDGTLLSSTIPQFDLRVDFKAINKDTFRQYVDTLATCMSRLFADASADDYRQQLKNAYKRGDRYWLLRKNAPYYEYQAVRNFPLLSKGKNKGGFIAEPRSRRVNPYGMLAYRTVGLFRENADNIGLEKKYDSVLCGKQGRRIIRKTTGGTWMPIEGSEVDPINGQDIVTTLDINIQDITEHALLDVLTKNNCQYGTAIVMEVKTGKIRALANLGRQSDGSYWEDFNYAMIPTEPGSTFKLMSLYSLLEDGYVTINDNVNAQGGVAVFGNQRVVDDHGGLGLISIKKAFAQSSNVAFAKLVNQYYFNDPMKYIRHLQKLKLNIKTGIDLTGERSPRIKTTSSSDWNKVTSLPWIGYGYESLITPLHTCMVYNAVANNGRMMKPYLVSAIREYGLNVKEFKPTVLVDSIGKRSTVAQMQQAMRAVVEEGTARGIKSPYYTAAGKTGTAQVADKGISYADGVRQGSFVGYFPYENPQYTIAVVVRSTPHGSYYGAVVGAPVFKAIADKLYAAHIGGWRVPADSLVKEKRIVAKKAASENLVTVMRNMGMPAPAENWRGIAYLQPDSSGRYALRKVETSKSYVPDVSGMGLRDALYILENTGLQVSVSGNGKVVTQSLQAGNKVIKGQHIHIQLG
ncbi:penicillin-binding protein [Taibaiella chishuiensis]|uniref:Cell division protein FtsI (Penicillin-binding protein 3) n=1 Tax=Taibaiella chishuiensis TaxID=1434707 RepID=A0A2P8DBY6_9BACT|nr:penicillin-binding protein [Taibaiella chishuiensis]PSK94738.1 cell division protein FtsI (penicillin-binding protein 3) [Taibaiella chishuiensis]